jgi:hypothetical protein
MLNPRGVDIYGFIAIGAMTLMLVLVVAKVVPPRMYSPLFYAAAALFAIRIVLRIALTRQRKKEAELSGEGRGPDLFRGREVPDITFAEDFCAVVCVRRDVKPVTRTERPFVLVRCDLHLPFNDDDKIIEIMFVPPVFHAGTVRVKL